MKAVFADTFFWIAITDPRDSSQPAALQLMASVGDCLIVTTDEVLTELLAYFAKAKPGWRVEAGKAVREILADSWVRVIPQSRESFLAGLELYLERPDKAYSLTDCISMQTMRREGLSEALTNDRHFEQEGFRALFRS